MDVSFTEQEKMLQERAREFLEEEVPSDLAREMEADPEGYPPELWRKMADLGWLGIAFPTELGGNGLSFFDMAILYEEMGRAVAPVPYMATVVLSGLTVLDAAGEELKLRILPQVAFGDLVLSFAYLEPNKPNLGFVNSSLSTIARRDGNAYVLNGTKHFVQYAQVSDMILTLAVEEASGEAVWLLVDRNAEGVDVTHLSTTGGDQQCHVTFRDTPVPDGNRLTGDTDAWAVLGRAVQRGAVALCAYLSGAGQKVVDLSVEYAKTRVQFGRPISAFQAVRHRCADMAADALGARFLTYEAAWMVSEGLPAELEVSNAKACVGDAIWSVMTGGHQVHGSIGFTEEHPMPLYSRRAKVGQSMFGNADLHRERVAERLGL